MLFGGLVMRVRSFLGVIAGALFLSASAANAALYSFSFVGGGFDIFGTMDIAPAGTFYSAQDILSISGQVTYDDGTTTYSQGIAGLVPVDTNNPPPSQDPVTGFFYDNLYYNPVAFEPTGQPIFDLSGLLFTDLAGVYYHIYIEASPVYVDPLEVSRFPITFNDPIEGSIAIDPTPLPAALPLMGSVLGSAGLLAWRRKRKAATQRAT